MIFEKIKDIFSVRILVALLMLLRIEIVQGQLANCSYNDSSSCYISEQFGKSEFISVIKYELLEDIFTPFTPLLADVDGDCISEVIYIGLDNQNILIFNSKGGTLKNTIYTPVLNSESSNLSICLADIDGDNIPEIFAEIADNQQNPSSVRGKIICYNADGKLRWISDQKISNSKFKLGGTPAIADFNQDGIPEIYLGNSIFDATKGIKLAEGGSNGVGTPTDPGIIAKPISIAAQLDDDDKDLELAAGYTIYKVVINNQNGIAGNAMIPNNIQVDNEFRDGYTVVADINKDGKLDVIVASPNFINNNELLYIYSLINGSTILIAKVYPPGIGQIGVPLIDDLNGTGRLSIIFVQINNLLSYFFDGASVLKLEWSYKIMDNSGTIGVTAFDFNNDMKKEIVFRDEFSLNILDCSTISPKNLSKLSCFSPTWFEYPIVGDFDNSGHAQICVPCAYSANDAMGKLTVFAPPDSLPGWAPARGIWNQYNYHVLNINDDLTVPRVQKNNATYKNGKYNNFFVQESLLEDGKYRKKAANLSGKIKCVNYDPITNEYSILFDIYNRKDASFHADSNLPVSFYQGDPANGGILLGTYFTKRSLASGDSLLNLVYNFSASGLKDVFMVVNTTRDKTGAFDPKDFTIPECDYTDNLFRTMELPLLEKRIAEICTGSSYAFYDSSLTVAGTYHHILQNKDGCDSLVSILELFTTDTVIVTQTAEACNGYFWNGVRYSQSGQYVYDTTGSFGCDSTTVLQLTIHRSSDTIIKQKACDRYSWNGMTYDSSGTYVIRLINSGGCDSTLTLALEVHYTDSVILKHTTCNDYLWHGVKLNQSGVYTFDTINRFGCDSTTTLQLNIVPVIQTNESQTACDRYIWNGTVYTQSGIYSFQTKSYLGCDSIVSLDLTINHSWDSTIYERQCDQYQWNGMTYDQSGTYPFVTKTSAGCDSTITLQLQIKKSTQSTMDINTCDQYLWNGKFYTQSGTYQYRTQNESGCDSTATLNLVINKSDVVNIHQTACDSLRWNNLSYDQSGNYLYKTINSNGCDSTVHLELTIHQSSSENVTMSVCDSLMYLGKVLKFEGKYVYVLQDIHGCDSTIHLNLEILSENQREQASACDSFRWDRNGITYEQSGIHAEKYINRFGCDSIHSIALNIHPSYRNQQSVDACKEYYWPVRQTRLTKTGEYTERLRTVQGCDSLIGLQLTIHPEYERTDTVTSKIAYIWPVNNQRYEKTGSYQQVYTSVYGCDSTHKLVLFIKEDVGIYAPNVIQPGGINGGFIIFDNGYTIHNIRTLSIYDRWGNLIWQKQNLEANKAGQGWDGRVQGQNAMPGVYVWIAELELEDGQLLTKKGDVTVMR